MILLQLKQEAHLRIRPTYKFFARTYHALVTESSYFGRTLSQDITAEITITLQENSTKHSPSILNHSPKRVIASFEGPFQLTSFEHLDLSGKNRQSANDDVLRDIQLQATKSFEQRFQRRPRFLHNKRKVRCILY